MKDSGSRFQSKILTCHDRYGISFGGLSTCGCQCEISRGNFQIELSGGGWSPASGKIMSGTSGCIPRLLLKCKFAWRMKEKRAENLMSQTDMAWKSQTSFYQPSATSLWSLLTVSWVAIVSCGFVELAANTSVTVVPGRWRLR